MLFLPFNDLAGRSTINQMKLITNISRLLVGSLFIVSGLIKANDPIGFSYKLEEYFSADVLSMEWLGNYALSLAVLVCIAEIVLGVATLLGTRMKLVSWALLLMMGGFTFLTFYSAYFNKVTDCGCFGDALKITPWQSFFKDIVLLLFVIILFVKKKSILTNTLIQDIAFLSLSVILIAIFSYGVLSWGFPVWLSLITFVIIVFLNRRPGRSSYIAFGIPVLFSLIFSIYVIRHLPIKDFRPYAIGKSIPEQMKIPEDAQPDVYKNSWYYKDKDGVTNEYTDEDKPWEKPGLVFVDRKTMLIKKGYQPPIHDFSITSYDGDDYTEDFINDTNYSFLLIAYDITKTNKTVQKEVNALAETCSKEGISFTGLTASMYEKTEEFRHDVQSPYDYYTADETTLKTIIRSNPGLLLLKDGVIIQKWHYNDFPSFDEAMKIINDE